MRPANWTNPKWFEIQENPKSEIPNPKSKRLRQDLNPQPQDSYSCALIPLSYEAIKKRARGFEPPTCSVETNCSRSVELRPHLDLGFLISDLGFANVLAANPKSEIEVWDMKKSHFSSLLLGGNWQARSDLNWKLRFWRPTFCQLKLRAHNDFGFGIADLGFNFSKRLKIE